MKVLALSIFFIISGITFLNSDKGLCTPAEHIEQPDQFSDIHPELPGLSIDEEEAESTKSTAFCSALELTKTDIDCKGDSSYSKLLLRPPRRV